MILVRLANNGQRVTSSRQFSDISFELPRHEFQRTLYVLRELRDAGLVLNLPWLADEQASLRFGTTRLITLVEGTTVEACTDGRRPKCLLMSPSTVHKFARKTLRSKGRHAELVSINVTAVAAEPT
jgi:hypothetical protein